MTKKSSQTCSLFITEGLSGAEASSSVKNPLRQADGDWQSLKVRDELAQLKSTAHGVLGQIP
jgi:hypothetical protein